MDYIPIKVCKIHYTPRSYHAVNRTVQPLIVYIRGLTKEGKTVDVELHNTVPRFWVKSEKNPIEKIPASNHKCILSITREGKNIYHDPLWCIRVQYPFDVPTIRKSFKIEDRHQDHIVYEDAVRTFYDIKDTIAVPRECAFNDVPMTPDQIRQSDERIEYLDWYIDIETGDSDGFGNPENPVTPIRNMTFTNMTTGEHHQFITKPVDKKAIRKMLSNRRWLMKNLSIGELFDKEKLDVIPKDKIHIYCPDEEKSEKWLFKEVKRFLNRVKPARLGEHAGYDTAYIKARLIEGNFKTRISWDKLLVWDSMDCYARFIEGSVAVRGRAALDWIGIREFGYGKIKRPGIDDMYYDDPELLACYNIWDCELPRRFCKKTMMMNLFSSITDYAGTNLKNFNQTQQIVIMTLLHKLNPMGIFLPTFKKDKKGKGKKKGKKMKGGFVADSPVGMYFKVIELDFSKEYPSIIRALNLDFFTRLRDMCSHCKKKDCKLRVDGRMFIEEGCDMDATIPVIKCPSPASIVIRQDEKGIIPEIMKELGEERDKIRAKMREVEKSEGKYTPNWNIYYQDQFTRKEIMNSFFGVLARLVRELGDAITDCARRHLKWNREKLTERSFELRNRDINFTVIYSDTDSCKIIINELEEIEKEGGEITYEELYDLGDRVAKYLNSTYSDFFELHYGTRDHFFDVKIEDIYKRYMSWGAKKRYAFTTWENTLHVKGIDIRRSDTPTITRKAQERFFEMVLGGRFDKTGDWEPEDRKAIGKWLRGFIQEIRDGKRDMETGKPKGINSESKTTQQYKAAAASNKYLGKRHRLPGSKPIMYEHKGIRGMYYPRDVLVSLEWGEDPNDYNIILNYDIIIKKHIRKKLEGPLMALGIMIEDLESGMRTENCEDGY
ncbi:MAG: DNA polymerase domain-containing protein [Candidatus Hodarchaeales archaeon]